jgi:repressor LexA
MRERPPLTRQQKRVLDIISRYSAAHDVAPTLDEIGKELGVHRVTVFEHVRALKQKGYLDTSPNLSRSIRLKPDPAQERGLPILGRIAAGDPIEAIVDPEVLTWDSFVPPGRDCYLLQVQGESMIDDHIQDGDLVLVEARSNAQPGETIVALIHGRDATLKRYHPMGARVRLQPRNPAHAPIEVDARDLQIQGVVIGVLRRY